MNLPCIKPINFCKSFISSPIFFYALSKLLYLVLVLNLTWIDYSSLYGLSIVISAKIF